MLFRSIDAALLESVHKNPESLPGKEFLDLVAKAGLAKQDTVDVGDTISTVGSEEVWHAIFLDVGIDGTGGASPVRVVVGDAHGGDFLDEGEVLSLD